MTITDTKKVMFEIYRDPDLDGTYRVVYFTELGEHDKEEEIGKAMRGEHVFEGFILHHQRKEAKELISKLLERLNDGALLSCNEIAQELHWYLC